MVGQFWPKSSCNVVYKLISKIFLTEHLKVVLPRLISPFQLVFVPRRVIQDNYIVAAEIFHQMNHKRGKGGWIEIKADMVTEWNGHFSLKSSQGSVFILFGSTGSISVLPLPTSLFF